MPGPSDKRLAAKKFGSSTMGPSRRMWTIVRGLAVNFYVHTEENEEFTGHKEEGNDMYLLFGGASKTSTMRIDLTSMTEAELTAFRAVVDTACANALPVCKRRDAVADAAMEEGSTKYTRVFREWPRIFMREGTKEFPNYPQLMRYWTGESGSKLVQSYGRNEEKVDGNSGQE